LTPPDYRLPALESDYESMKGMLFGEIPSFEAVMDAVRQLENEINA